MFLGINENRREFNVSCPYCNSTLGVKANRKLRFKNYYFTDADRPNDILLYRKVPTWKCPACRNRFALNTKSSESYTLEDIPKYNSFFVI